MKITFLGTGTSMGVPTAGGYSYRGPSGDSRDHRLRCSIWIQTSENSILIDIGPDFRTQTLRSGLKHIDALLITHEHIDHIGGLDDLRPFVYKRKASIPTWSTREAGEALRRRFDYMFGSKKVPGSVDLDMHVADGPFMIGNDKVIPIPARHGSMNVLGFRIGAFSYLTDINDVPPSSIDIMKGSKYCVLGALRWEPSHRTHYTIPETVEIAQQVGADQTYLVHMSSQVRHQESNDKLPTSIDLAYDQMVLRC